MSKPMDTTPAMALTPQALDHLVEELRASHAIDSPLFRRREQRAAAEKYLHGLLRELPRKSIEPMVLALAGAKAKAVRPRQVFISAGAWDDDALLPRHWQEVETSLGEDEGVLTLDGSDFLKQGQESVGVQRQYCGDVGKRANGQAGVYVGDASRPGYTLLDRRLSVPQAWVVEEACAERRRRCGVPQAITFQTKPTLGGQMIEAVHRSGFLRARWVTCDEACGRDTRLLDHIDGLGLGDCAEVPPDTHAWRPRPATAVPAWSGQGRTPKRPRVLTGEATPAAVAPLAGSRPAARWVRRTIKAGSKGPLVARVAAWRVIAVREGLPGPEVWLVLRRHLGTGELKTSLCHAPIHTPVATLGRLSGRRWPLETGFEDGKPDLGMGDDEVRSWRGWHHPMTRCSLAHGFLARVRRRFKKSAELDHPPGAGAVVPHPTPACIRRPGGAGTRRLLATAEPCRLCRPSEAPYRLAQSIGQKFVVVLEIAFTDRVSVVESRP
jgi:SRSO17 transposase